MVKQTLYIESKSLDPHKNLAIEEYLFHQCGKEEAILYLWQNAKTIVIGKTQNVWRECQISKIEEEGAVIARRISGGGAVYHDLGNLNFTFLVHKENYDLEKQMSVILKAVQKLGIQAETSGRNDILIEGRKFSGNAFHENQGHCYHHGTIMVDVNLEKLGTYLNVSKKKLESKGVKSVHSRVANLRDYNSGISVDQLKNALRETFEEVYGLKSQTIKETEFNQKEIQKLNEKYSSWDWVYGREFAFEYEVSERFHWGEIHLQFCVDRGRVTDVAVYSDALNPDMILEIPQCLKGKKYNNHEMADAIKSLNKTKKEENIFKDVEQWIRRVVL